MLGQLDDEGGQPVFLRASQPTGAGTVRAYGDDLGRVAGAGGIQQSLQQRPDAGHQDNDPGRNRQAKLVHGVLTVAGEITRRGQTSQ